MLARLGGSWLWSFMSEARRLTLMQQHGGSRSLAATNERASERIYTTDDVTLRACQFCHANGANWHNYILHSEFANSRIRCEFVLFNSHALGS